ncbi:acyl-CoA synthetase [Desulfovirgula thermocuniculi]|uniref:acyl-CoA synthetase n=1 Tax=Desulfovirgula thermocuniculi TaxID=348842 RepID=UPI000427BB36|nr:long-chain fatty acid--CoA ligase [Desulfovirgula thermocuniculi]
MNMGQLISHRALLSPNLEAFKGPGYSFSFHEANRRVNQCANFLKMSGIGQGDRVAILCRNNHYIPTVLFAAAKIGAITVILNWRLAAPEISYILSHSGSAVLIYEEEFSTTVEALRGSAAARIWLSTSELEDQLQEQSDGEPGTMVGGEWPALIMYTSGTTGRPKGATLSHSNLIWAAIGITRTIDWRYRDRFLSVAPLFHIGGLAPIITNVYQGCTTVFLPGFDPLQVWETIVNEEINIMMSVPTMLALMLKAPNLPPREKLNLRYFICGGSAVPTGLIDAYRERNINVLQVYGITEYSGAVTFWTPEMGMEKRSSAGKPVFHGKVKILCPQTGAELPAGEIGEIACSGPQVFKGYWNDPGATAKVLRDGWYCSGDLGKIDDEGFIYVIDRLKDMIISGGENIYPAELERVIGSLPGVLEVAVVGIPDEKWGEVPRAYVVKAPGSALTEEDVKNACLANLARYKCVKEVVFVDSLPRNAVGKILKNVLREMR